MELRHLRLIKTVAAEQNLTKAAEKLFLSQSALSHQLRELEEEYKLDFFIRINKKMILTQAGELFLQSADEVLQSLDKLDCKLKKMSSESEGTIRFTTECYTCYHWLPSVFFDFNRTHPNVELQINTDATNHPHTYLENGKIDLAIVIDFKEEEYPQFQQHLLFEDELLAIFSPSHPWKEKKHIDAADIVTENFITYNDILDPANNSFIYQHIFHPNGVLPKKIIQIKLTEAIIEMVKAGMGVSFMARWAVLPYLENVDILARPIGKKPFLRSWSAITLKGLRFPTYTQNFIELMKKNIQGNKNLMRQLSA